MKTTRYPIVFVILFVVMVIPIVHSCEVLIAANHAGDAGIIVLLYVYSVVVTWAFFQRERYHQEMYDRAKKIMKTLEQVRKK